MLPRLSRQPRHTRFSLTEKCNATAATRSDRRHPCTFAVMPTTTHKEELPDCASRVLYYLQYLTMAWSFVCLASRGIGFALTRHLSQTTTIPSSQRRGEMSRSSRKSILSDLPDIDSDRLTVLELDVTGNSSISNRHPSKITSTNTRSYHARRNQHLDCSRPRQNPFSRPRPPTSASRSPSPASCTPKNRPPRSTPRSASTHSASTLSGPCYSSNTSRPSSPRRKSPSLPPRRTTRASLPTLSGQQCPPASARPPITPSAGGIRTARAKRASIA